MKERIEDIMLDVIFDIRPSLPDWCPEDKLQKVDSENIIWDIPERITLKTGEGTEAMFRTSAVRLLIMQFKSAEWYLSAPDPGHKSSLFIGVLKAVSREGKNVTRYLMLAPKVEPEKEAKAK